MFGFIHVELSIVLNRNIKILIDATAETSSVGFNIKTDKSRQTAFI